MKPIKHMKPRFIADKRAIRHTDMIEEIHFFVSGRARIYLLNWYKQKGNSSVQVIVINYKHDA